MQSFTTPVLLIIFNRLDVTKQVFNSIRQQQPKYLFIAADGSRPNIKDDVEKCKAVHEYVLNNIDWDCELKTLFQDVNLGCGLGPATAITWFFEQVEAGIILEDDCVPHSDFFKYCEILLQKHTNNKKIAVIGGDNFQDGIIRGNASYYYSKYSYTWGWATWRRAWENYDFDLKTLDRSLMWKKIDSIFKTKNERKYWKSTFETIKISHDDVWDYQFWFHIWYYNMFSIAPNVNLVKNIGFGEDATHTIDISSNQAFLGTRSILPLIHPTKVKIDESADKYYFKKYWYSNSDQTLFTSFVTTLYKYLPNRLISKYRVIKNTIIQK